MLEEVLLHIHNWFVVASHCGKWKIEGGALDLPFLQEGQYYRIVGSVFNDGLHRYVAPGVVALDDEADEGDEKEPEETEPTPEPEPEVPELIDEDEFNGVIYSLAIPKAVIKLAEDIEEWQTKYSDTVNSPYSSESFGGYSYTKAIGKGESGNDLDNTGGWQVAFRSRLNHWRKLS